MLSFNDKRISDSFSNWFLELSIKFPEERGLLKSRGGGRFGPFFESVTNEESIYEEKYSNHALKSINPASGVAVGRFFLSRSVPETGFCM